TSRRTDGKGFSIGQMQDAFAKYWAAQLIVRYTRRHRIKTHRAEDIPARKRTKIVIPRKAAGNRGIRMLRQPAHILLRLPGLTDKVEQIRHMQRRFIVMDIIPL